MPNTHDVIFRRKIYNITFAIIIGLAVVGFALGTRPMEHSAEFIIPKTGQIDKNAVPGQAYLELRQRRFGPNHKVTSDLADLQQGLPSVFTPIVKTEEDYNKALTDRTKNRAYDGAPPVIPHPIDEQNTGACIACHEKGVIVQGRIAPAMSHPPLANCTQCHVYYGGLKPPATAFNVENHFNGLTSPGQGSRAWVGAPPTIPHFTWMRQNCGSCHGVTGKLGIRTPHADRGNCEQCHVPVVDRQISSWPLRNN